MAQIVFRLDLYQPANVQVLRSSSTWSAGLGETEHSILNTYETLIEHSQKFIFIEDQFFVTSTGAAHTSGAKEVRFVH